MNNIKYHRATINDLQVVVEMRIEFIKEIKGTFDIDSVDKLRSGLNEYFKKHLADNSFISYFAKDRDLIVGIGGLVFREQPGNFENASGNVGYVVNMFTLPEYRSRGIADKILKLLIEEGNKRGLLQFELHSTKKGESVYVKNGFKIHSQPTYRRYLSEEIMSNKAI